jgi:protein-tyrosine phosphatase
MPYTDYNWIHDRLAIGAMLSEPEDLPFDTILSMETHAPATVRGLVRSGNVEYRWLSIVDGYSWETDEEIVRRFDDAADQLHEWLTDDKRVLVHCTAGVSRSVTAVVWYLIRYKGHSWDEALALVKSFRSVANPNIRFEISLRLASGEQLNHEWLEERINAYCAELKVLYNYDGDVQEVWHDLQRQGTWPLLPAEEQEKAG